MGWGGKAVYQKENKEKENFCRQMQSYSPDFTLQTSINVFKINMCHPEGPGQAGEVGAHEPHEVQRGQAEAPVPG